MSDLCDHIRTERLLLRPWSLADVDAVYEFAGDEQWARHLPVPVPYKRRDAERFIAQQLLLPPDRHISWAIECVNACVGGINIRFVEEGRVGELGYSIARRTWGKGFATESTQAVVDEAFSARPNVERVRAMSGVRNGGSRRVLEKVGMTYEGTLRRNRYVRGEAIDEAWYGLLREEWNAQRRS